MQLALVAAGSPPAFQRLRALLLGNNALAGWADVQALDAFAALADVRLSGNPVLRNAPGGGRYEVHFLQIFFAYVH